MSLFITFFKKIHKRVDLFLVQIVALFSFVLAIAVATATPFVFLSLLLKDSTVVGVVGRILAMQETVEFIFSVVLVAIIVTAFLVPAGFVFVG